MSILITVDGQSPTPIFRQVVEQVIALVESDAVKPGVRLPSTRSMADKLAVNRSTIYRAYRELWSMGYLESRPGSYTTVRKRTQVVSGRVPPRRGLIKWTDRITSGAASLHALHVRDEALNRKAADPDVINFIPLSPDTRLFPIDAFRRCMAEVLIDEGALLLQYGSPLGYPQLRRTIAERMRQHSISISADEIAITTGAQGALALVLNMLAEPGAAVAVEAPTYSRLIDILRLNHSRVLSIPMGAEGMDLKALEMALSRESPSLIYTMPNFHNPTGITTDQAHREKLLRICEHHRIPLVEDGFEEEMKYFGKSVLPIKSMDRRGVVIYIGTFSKILFPGLRIGWIAADEAFLSRLASIQRASILSGNLLDQAALYRLCAAGHYDLHVRRMHRVYRKRMQTALKAMREHLDPARVEWTQPVGGYTIWLVLKGFRLSEDELVDHLLNRGVAVLPGSTQFHGKSRGISFRISIGHLDEPKIEEGIRRLAAGLAELHRRQKRRCSS